MRRAFTTRSFPLRLPRPPFNSRSGSLLLRFSLALFPHETCTRGARTHSFTSQWRCEMRARYASIPFPIWPFLILRDDLRVLRIRKEYYLNEDINFYVFTCEVFKVFLKNIMQVYFSFNFYSFLGASLRVWEQNEIISLFSHTSYYSCFKRTLTPSSDGSNNHVTELVNEFVK